MDIGFEKEKAVIGTRQVVRLLDKDGIRMVYLAEDADDFVKDKVKSACKKAGVECVEGMSKEEMGKRAGIEVFAACFGILK